MKSEQELIQMVESKAKAWTSELFDEETRKAVKTMEDAGAKVEEISLLTNEFRRDCIRLLSGSGEMTDEAILEGVAKTIRIAKGEATEVEVEGESDG